MCWKNKAKKVRVLSSLFEKDTKKQNFDRGPG
jgi:hypothetical protein